MAESDNNLISKILEAVNYARDGVAVLTLDWEIVYYNDVWVEIHGLDPGLDYIGKNLKDVERKGLHPILDQAREILMGSGVYINQIGATRRDGKYQETYVVASLVAHTDPQLVLLVMREVADLVQKEGRLPSNYDYLEELLEERTKQLQEANLALTTEIDDRKRVEKALRESETKYRILAEQSLDGIIIAKDGPLRLVFVNQAMAQITGYGIDELLSLSPKKLAGLVHEDDWEMFLSRFRDRLQGKRPQQQYEVRMVNKDGALKWLTIHSTLIEYEGEPAALATFSDITEHKQADEALQRSEEKLKAQYKNLPVPTYTWQGDGKEFVLTDYNDAALEMTEGKVSNYVGVKSSEFCAGTPEILEELSRCFMERVSIQREMLYRMRTTGEMRYLDVRYAFVPPDLVLVHADDITERKRAEEELSRHREHLEELVAERTGELEKRNRELAIVNEINVIINSTEKPERGLERILEIVSDFSNARYAILCEVNHEQKELTLLASHGLTREIIEKTSKMSMNIERVNEMLLSPRNVYEIDLSLMQVPEYKRIKDLMGVKRVLGFNCRLHGRANFVAYLGITNEAEIEPDSLDLLEMAGSQLGIALERQRLLDTLERRELELKNLTAGLIDLIEDERRQIALSLHDDARQSLVAIKVELDMLKKHLPHDEQWCLKSLESIEKQLQDITDSTRRISYSLHPSMLEDLGLIPALQWYVDRFVRSEGLRVDIESVGFDEELPLQVALTLYRVAQEALTNVVRHSGAGVVSLKITKGYPRVIMVIEDNGTGFLPEEVIPKKGLGIVGMRERVELLGGSFRLKSSPGHGVNIRVTIPLEVELDRKH
ncbi:MAG: PAS domain S-box protein [bacterium]|nr:MAG: PAS domain S-box protein [bacterium]